MELGLLFSAVLSNIPGINNRYSFGEDILKAFYLIGIVRTNNLLCPHNEKLYRNADSF